VQTNKQKTQNPLATEQHPNKFKAMC